MDAKSGVSAAIDRPSRRLSSRAPLLTAVVLLVLATVIALQVNSRARPTTFAMHAVLLLMGPTAFDEDPVVAITHDNSCYGALSYGDLDWAARVTLTSGSDQLGTGALSEGQIITGGCRFTFDVKDVPRGRSAYAVHILDRGPWTFSEKQLEHGVTIRLGRPATG